MAYKYSKTSSALNSVTRLTRNNLLTIISAVTALSVAVLLVTSTNANRTKSAALHSQSHATNPERSKDRASAAPVLFTLKGGSAVAVDEGLLFHHRPGTYHSLLNFLAPIVTASKTDSLFTDVDGDLQADPGDTLKYTVSISAGGEDATGVTFTDTVDPNTAFVGGSLTATPVAVNDSYSAIGNVRISVPAGSGVLANDFVGLPAATITGAPAVSANGGDVAVSADGSFTYNPAPGFEGSDSFTYTLTNSEGSNNATVNITVSGMIWFVNEFASCPCNGRLTNPFVDLSGPGSFDSGAADDPGDNIFLYTGAYTGGLTLLANQRLIGEGASASLSSITGLTPPSYSDPLPATGGARPGVENAAGSNILLTSGNYLRGFDIGDSAASGSAISGGMFGTLTVTELSISGTGRALNLTTGTLAAVFDGISSTNSATTGISLNTVSGSLTSNATTITNPTGIGIEVLTSGVNLDLANTAVNGSGGTGIRLDNNGGNFIVDDLDIAADAGQRAFHATSNTGTFSSTSGTISGSGATAVEIVGPSPAMRTLLDMTLTSVSANGGVNGILLQNTGTNPSGFTVRGDGSLARNGSGGTITGVTDDGIALTTADNITLQSMNLTNNGDTAPASIADAESITGDQTVQISGGSNVILSGVLIQNPTGSGIVALNLSGTNRVNSDSRITQLIAGQRHGIFVNNVNTNMTLFEFKNSQMIDFSSSLTAFQFVNGGTSNMTLDVKGSTFEDLAVQAVQVAAGGLVATTGTLTSTIGGPAAADRNFFQNAKGTGENNVALLVANGAVHVGTIENNLFDNIAENGSVANTSIIRTQNNGGKMTAVVKSNTIQNIVYAAGGRHVIGHVFVPAVFNAANFSDLRFEGNNASVTYTGTNREFTFIDYNPTASGGDIKIINNTFTITGADAQQLFELRFRPTNASTIDLLVDGNIGTGSTTAPYLDVDSEAAATVNATITNNTLTNLSATPGQSIDVASEAATSSLCANISGNVLAGVAANTITLNEAAGNMTVTQASAAAMTAANAGAVVTVLGTPTFGAPPCALPMNATNLLERGKSQNSNARIATNTPRPVVRRAPRTAPIAKANAKPLPLVKAQKPNPGRNQQNENLTSLSNQATDRSTVLRHHASVRPLPANPTLADVMLTIGTLPAGESVTITFKATVDDPFTGPAQVCNQGTVSGTNFSNVLTDDPDVGGAADATCTPIEQAAVTVAVSPASVAEDGATNLVYTFTRSGSTASALTVNFSIGGSATFGASPNDYTQTGAATFTPPTGTVTFSAGSSTAMVTVDPEADSTVEPDETVDLTVTAGTGYVVGAPSSASGTIANDDTEVSVAVSPASVAEDGATNLVYTFTRNGSTTNALTVNFSIGGTATFGASPNDYTQTGATTFTPPTGTVTFSAGSSTAMVTVNPESDSTVEPDETVDLTITSGTGYNVGSPSSASGTITNDDADVSVTVAPSSVAEDGATNLVYTLTRTGFTSGALVVNFSVGGTAVFSQPDYSQSGATTYTDTSGTVTFGAGNTTAMITIDPTADGDPEADETVILTLTAGAGYNVVSPSSATGTILNDDTVVTVTVTPASTAESGANLVYTFSRSGNTAAAVTVNFSVGGSASFPADYSQSGAATFTPPTATVTIGAGNSSAAVTVTPLADCISGEGPETVQFTVQPGTGYTVGVPGSATGTINDVPDTQPPVIVLNPNRPMSMWPPNHDYHNFTTSQFIQSASDACDPNVDASDVYITKIESDEAEDGAGDGNTTNDITIAADCKSFQLRSERSVAGNGRVYTITFKVQDNQGNFTTLTAEVRVPVTMNGTAVKDATMYMVTSVCP